MTPEEEKIQHDAIIKMSLQIETISETIGKLPCAANTDTITRHDEKIKTLWIPFTASIMAFFSAGLLCLREFITKG